MTKTINVAQLERELRGVLTEVSLDRTSFLILGDDRPAVAIVPYGEYERLLGRDDETAFARFDEVMARLGKRNAAFPDEEVMADVKAAISESRR